MQTYLNFIFYFLFDKKDCQNKQLFCSIINFKTLAIIPDYYEIIQKIFCSARYNSFPFLFYSRVVKNFCRVARTCAGQARNDCFTA